MAGVMAGRRVKGSSKMSEPEYSRLVPLEVQRLYATMDVTPTEGVYQVMSGENLWSADPLGLYYYVYGEGELQPEDGYDTLAMALDLPVAYIIGFDISYEGGNVREQVESAAIEIDVSDPDLWYGSGDGAKCRLVVLKGVNLSAV